MSNERELGKVIFLMIIANFISLIGLISAMIGNINGNYNIITFSIGFAIGPLILSTGYFIYKYIIGDIT